MTRVQDTKKRLLVALDGSDFTFETIKYIRQIPTFKERQLVLFSVFTSIPSRYWDLQQEAVFRSKVTEIRSWEAQRKQETEGYLANAKQMLLDDGFSDESVEIVIHAMNRGIERDIIAEAGKGYAALVVGKRGKGRVQGIVLGSVATKLLQEVRIVPLFLVGKAVRPGRVLIAFDGSEGSMRAVDCVADMLNGSGYRINLTHVVRLREDERGFIADAEQFISEAFDKAVDRLIAAGIARDLISTQIITGARSRAQTLVKEADQGVYGTIVLGRRGISRINEFLMGGVSNKVIQLARGHAVWVVS
ncbi:MAG: universal stress protein [Deltaproteobacteria bacterium]|nr:universal stress protein [Deltaproteobacteria bacterium]